MTLEQTEAARLAIEIDLESVAEVAASYGVHPKTWPGSCEIPSNRRVCRQPFLQRSYDVWL